MFEEQRTLYERRIETFSLRLQGLLYEQEVPLEASFCIFDPMVPFKKRLQGEYKPIRAGDAWGENWEHAWFRLTGIIPDGWKGKKVCARINLGGEACIFSPDGTPLQGLSLHSLWLDNFVRDRFDITESATGGEQVELWLEASAGQLFGLQLERDPTVQNPKRFGYYQARIKDMVLGVFRQDIWQLSLDVLVLNDLMKSLPEKSVRRARILHALNRAIDCFQEDEKGVAHSRDCLKSELDKKSSASSLTTVAVGHAHLDTAWLWPLSETIRKCARTFSTQLALLDKYPDYVFGASQPQHYAFVKEHYPLLYARIKEKVAEGRWELQGGMWVEADCNLIDGESMVRQILIGKNFFMEEFGIDVKNLWIPDVFGYSAAMPQILKKSGLDYLVTQKLSWNQFNKFPYNTFKWRGIDGSEVIVHFPPENTYNSLLRPSGLRAAQENFKEKDFIDEFLTLFGIGDGGGGATEEIIETGLRQKDLEGSPRMVFGQAQDFLDKLAEHRDELPVWSGELYLELHRGTLTTQAFNKKMNRLLESRLKQVEMLYACLPLKNYPTRQLEAMWRKLLLNQFHDILPGSSVNLVYKESKKDYEELNRQADELLEQASSLLLEKKNGCICFVNTLSYTYSRPVELPNDWAEYHIFDDSGNPVPIQLEGEIAVALVEIPPMHSVTLAQGEKRARSIAGHALKKIILENEFIRYKFSEQGVLSSAYDKECERELFVNGQFGNVLKLYEDRPTDWDAWDIDIFYENQLLEQARLESWEWCSNGPVRQGVKMNFRIGNSTIEQKIYLAANSKRLDFMTAVNWQERHKMLRVSFAVDVHADTASYEIQFGYLKRNTHSNTSWDMAKFEVAAHKFTDLSESDYGVALLNDCKYGHKIHENVLEINLLRSPTNPDPEADLGYHTFTFCLLPHKGELIASDVFSQAAQLNHPLARFPGYSGNGFKLPCEISSLEVVCEVIKKAEKEDALIVRLFEPRGIKAFTKIKVSDDVAEIFETDLLENNVQKLSIEKGYVPLYFKSYEIKTLKLILFARS
jgi:alpha-mannosidase